jgi:hypothetical protein
MIAISANARLGNSDTRRVRGKKKEPLSPTGRITVGASDAC